MSKFFKRAQLAVIPVLSFAFQFGCAGAPPPAAVVPPYEPNFAYAAPSSAQKTDITLGLVRPQFKDSSAMYHQKYRDDDTVKAMLRSMDASIGEILVAKGFKTTGPFDSVNEMTFPEKKTADLLFYPEFDFTIEVKRVNPHPAPAKSTGFNIPLFGSSAPKKDVDPTHPALVCDAVIEAVGDVNFVAAEPETDQKMLNKKLDVTSAKQTIPDQEGDFCTNSDDPSQWPIKVKNAWNLAHELVFQSSMKALNDYVNVDEMQSFKASIKEVRDKKSY
jgi:hypothetical protein